MLFHNVHIVPIYSLLYTLPEIEKELLKKGKIEDFDMLWKKKPACCFVSSCDLSMLWFGGYDLLRVHLVLNGHEIIKIPEILSGVLSFRGMTKTIN